MNDVVLDFVVWIEEFFGEMLVFNYGEFDGVVWKLGVIVGVNGAFYVFEDDEIGVSSGDVCFVGEMVEV